MAVYLTGVAHYLPGEPLDHTQIADRLSADTRSRALGAKVLAANGIRTRHYALSENGEPTMLNEELAAEAVRLALKDSGTDLDEVGLLATGTTQGDVLVPGFASMVHGRLGAAPMEILSASGVCASSMAAFIAADRAVRCGDHSRAVVVGSELVSRALRQSRYGSGRTEFDAEFLRWTLSDGAGAAVLSDTPRPDGLSLRVDWTHLVSHAGSHPICMSAGATAVAPGHTWLDQPSAAVAEEQGMLWLRQDVKALPALFRLGLRDFMGLVQAGRFRPSDVDHVLCHYSAEHFRADIFTLLSGAGLMIPEERWYTNLHTRGNTGAASIFVMLSEAMAQGRFAPGDRILLIVPESGRFSLAFAHLTCISSSLPALEETAAASPLGEPLPEESDAVGWTLLELARVWNDFERRVRATPPVRRIESGTATIEDYQRLLLNMRQQVVDGGRWISRAASNFSVELFELRSAAIKHAIDEHRDYQLLERDYCAVGGSLDDIQSGQANVGSRALSAYMFHQASQPDPVDLLGAMFVIEGLGTALALGWARQLQQQLGLRDNQVSFLLYHGEADDEHFAELAHLLRTAVPDRATGARIVRTAEVVARLYALQLEEVA
jgi:3-oxoacyl-[acyl-carrier-protein] synthase III